MISNARQIPFRVSRLLRLRRKIAKMSSQIKPSAAFILQVLLVVRNLIWELKQDILPTMVGNALLRTFDIC